jgi:hypothetical protein
MKRRVVFALRARPLTGSIVTYGPTHEAAGERPQAPKLRILPPPSSPLEPRGAPSFRVPPRIQRP